LILNRRLRGVSPTTFWFDVAAEVNVAVVAARSVKPVCPASCVVSCVVTMLNVIVAAAVPARMDPVPVAHSIVCSWPRLIEFDATLSFKTVDDHVAAASVAVVLPVTTVHAGTCPVTKSDELAVMVMVSDTPAAPAVPDERAPAEDGVKTNLCLIGAIPSVSWLNEDAEPHTTGVAVLVE